MWKPRRLATLWASTACYKYSFTLPVIYIKRLLINIESKVTSTFGLAELNDLFTCSVMSFEDHALARELQKVAAPIFYHSLQLFSHYRRFALR
jgi:hypothetical protein